MWDQDCTNLIGVSALGLMNKMIEVVLVCLSIASTKWMCNIAFFFILGW